MDIVVCVKVIGGELNPFDENALEAALSFENANITVLCMGAMSASQALLRISRLNISRIILLSDNSLAGSDTLATSYALSCVIKKLSPKLVLCGRQSIDGDTAQVGACLSAMLSYSLATNVLGFSHNQEKNSIECRTRLGTCFVTLPALLTIERINTLRFPRIGSRPKEIEICTADRFGIDKSRCGIVGSPTRVIESTSKAVGARKCEFVTLDRLDEIIEKAMQQQTHKKAVYNATSKLESVAIVGDRLTEVAKGIAKNVRIVPPSTPSELAESLKNESVVLWEADLWGRMTAPQVAAYLNTGLCADCTGLETDGRKLFMLRPAKGETVIAKIECSTLPQMATVRCEERNREDIIFSLGRGVAKNPTLALSLAQRHNACICASRAYVDMNLAPYEQQVGLTGKLVSPKVYVACGISGAVQHVCGFENAGTVIAINSDKNADIFKYADYGIIYEL